MKRNNDDDDAVYFIKIENQEKIGKQIRFFFTVFLLPCSFALGHSTNQK